jgi:hypothetical protein
MAFKSDADQEAYANKLRAANFTEDEINADIKAINAEKSLPVAPPAPVIQPSSRAGGGGSPITQPEIAAAPLAPAAPREAVTALKDAAQARDEQNMNLTDQVWNSTIGKAVTGALGLYGAYKGGQALLNTETAQGLKKRFFSPPPEAVAIDRSIDIQMNEPSNRLPAAAQQSEAQFRASLSPTEQALYAKAQADKAAPTANISNEPYVASKVQLFPDEQLTPEQIRMNKQAAATQAIQQNLGESTAAPPPANTPKKIWEPPTASLALNAPATPTQTAAPAAASALPLQGSELQPVAPVANVAPEPVPTVPVEPVATPAAEPVATTKETPAAPVATDAERVQVFKDLEEPATKTTNEKIVETVTTPKETPKEEFVPRKWPGTSKGGAGAEGFALQQLGASRATYSKQHAAALEILKDRTNGILTQSPSGGGIHQQDQLSKMYEDYTGKPIPKTEKGGWARIPDSQVAELHAGILNELQEAAKGGKLKSLGKGALAAAALLGISEAVQAAQKGNFGPLKEAGFDISIGVLGGPAVMAGQMALTGQTLASGMTPKGQKEFQNRQEILGREGVKDYLQMLKQLNPNPADYTKAAEQYLATNPNAAKTKSQRFNEQTQQQRAAQTQKEHSLRK